MKSKSVTNLAIINAVAFIYHTWNDSSFSKMHSSAFEIEYTTSSLVKLLFESENILWFDLETEKSHRELTSCHWFSDLCSQRAVGGGTWRGQSLPPTCKQPRQLGLWSFSPFIYVMVGGVCQYTHKEDSIYEYVLGKYKALPRS